MNIYKEAFEKRQNEKADTLINVRILAEKMFGKHQNEKNTIQKWYNLMGSDTRKLTKRVTEFCKGLGITPNELFKF